MAEAIRGAQDIGTTSAGDDAQWHLESLFLGPDTNGLRSTCMELVARKRLERLRLTPLGPLSFRAAATYLPRAFRKAAAFFALRSIS